MKGVLLTVEMVANFYKKYPGEKIYYYAPQSEYDKNDKIIIPTIPKKSGLNWFIPTGELVLIPKKEIYKKDKSTIIYNNWLKNYKKGPYLKKEAGKNSSKFYYLLGLNNVYGYNYSMFQIASGPFNVMSNDPLDDILSWIPSKDLHKFR